MHRNVNDRDRIVGKYSVECVARQRLPLGHQVFVVAVAEEQVARLETARLRGGLKRRDDLVGILRGTHRGSGHIDAFRKRQRIDEVAVRIDESGHERLALEITKLRARPALGFHHRVLLPDHHDLAVLDSHCLSGRRALANRDDGSAIPNGVGVRGERIDRRH